MAAIDFPASPTLDDKVTLAGTDYTFNGTGWTTASDGGGGGGGTPVDAYTKAESDAKYVELTGDTMSGNLTMHEASVVVQGTAVSTIGLNKLADATNASVVSYTNGLPRWALMVADASPEASGNAGSDFKLIRHDDAGTQLDAPLTINRASGNATFWGAVAVNGIDGFYVSAGPTTLNTTLAVGGSATVNGGVNITSATPGLSLNANGASTGLINYTEAGLQYWVLQFTAGTFLLNKFSGGVQTGMAFSVDQGGSLTIAGRLYGMQGYCCKTGLSGALGGNVFNITHGATQNLWIDDTNVGAFMYQSDYRIKDNVVALPSMWDTVKALRPIKYTQKEYTPPVEETRAAETGVPFLAADPAERWGFIAHELQETLTPSAATGVKDQADCIQSPNPFTLLAAVTKALQEAMDRIEAQDARIAALEGAP